MTPQRIQLSRKKGWRMPPNTVKVDRSTKWGNPFRCAIVQRAVNEFEIQLRNDCLKVTTDEVRRELRGKNLACWCKPGAFCHADVLLRIANFPVDSTPLRVTLT